ncbi:conserved hypothetical protein [Burkholderia sp. 8Y]|uniref:hypothetical protein n=1 Tax=Burkholderia sp. 8Y TaxID=2653133 RepID=UPI0012F0871E|nr:hypothetical protein [Burkholderia sp. 8Y]VXC77869.1 conserved hypothetical protein [Burkholderia sp. 8Y]
MKVAELLVRLKSADPEAIVLMLGSLQDLSATVEVGRVHQLGQAWIREYVRLHDGRVEGYLRPPNRPSAPGFNAATGEAYEEQVVILASESTSID